VNESNGHAPRVIVVGTGAGGASAARELQRTCQVTILEAGREFRPLSLSMRWMERLKDWGLLFDERMIRLVFPSMKVRRARDGMVIVNGEATGGTTVLSTGNALRRDEGLRQLGIDLDREFAELSREVPVSMAHQAGWSAVTRRLFRICRERGLAPSPTPKLVDYSRCRRCGRCVLGCPYGAKWDSRRFLDDAIANGADLRCGYRVTKVVVRGGRAIGVRARGGVRTRFLPADLVVLAAGGLGTPVILERSGIRCEPRLFVDPVLCVAAPWPQSMQHREMPMPFVIQRPGYIVSPYFDYLSFLFNRGWRRPPGGVLGLMIKLADSEQGKVCGRRGRLDKGLTGQDHEKLAEAETLCRQILADFGVDPASIFMGTLNAGHPGGMLPLTAGDAETLHPERLPPNLYVADASLFPRSIGNPPILTILALARRVAREALEALHGERSDSGEQHRRRRVCVSIDHRECGDRAIGGCSMTVDDVRKTNSLRKSIPKREIQPNLIGKEHV
jgi:choline dehydrogenase-like flavoprotein